MHDDIDRILLSEAEIRLGIERLAREIGERFGQRELTVVAVLTGSCVFVADLIRRLANSIELFFVWAESYRNGRVAGRLDLRGLPPDEDVRGKHVLLVDDILDSGSTLCAVRRELLQRGAADVRTCVLLDKPSRRTADVRADFVGFVIEDLFVVGYGLDFAGRYRNLPYVGSLKARVLEAAETNGGPR